MGEFISNFFTVESWGALLFIFIAKVIEVAVSTLRIILMSKGYKTKAALLSFIEIMLWVFIASTVLTNVQAEPIKGVVYAVGYSVGIYVGTIVEGILALGQLLIQVVVDETDEKALIEAIRVKGFAVTSIKGKGKDSEKAILMIFANRKNHVALTDGITKFNPKAMIVVNEVSTIKGGYVQKLKGIVK